MLIAKNLVKTFPKSSRPVIDDISLEIGTGELVSMVGRSGSGKSTLLYLLSTLDRNFLGEVTYDSRNIQSMGVEEIHALRNEKIGFVFQFHYLLSELTALENVMLPTRKAKSGKFLDFALELLEVVGLKGKEAELPGALSGGEQQRVAIARALVMKPSYIFADEPTGNLDTANGENVMELFKRFNREFETSIIYVTHDQEFAARAPRTIHLVDGKIV